VVPLNKYLTRRFDQGYGENNTAGERTYYAGAPTPEIDAAWDQLERGKTVANLKVEKTNNRVVAKYIRITLEEANMLDTPTAQLHDESGYLVSLDVYHQLHCLNFLRMGLDPEYYSIQQAPEALKHHLGTDRIWQDNRQELTVNSALYK
jgi:hypothetical protein